MSQTRLQACRRAVPRRARTWLGGALCAAGGVLLTLGASAGDPGLVMPVFAGGPPHSAPAPAARRAPAATQAAQRATATQSVTTQAAPAPQTVTTRQIPVPETVSTQEIQVSPREERHEHAGGSHGVHREHHEVRREHVVETSSLSVETSSFSAVVTFPSTPSPVVTTSAHTSSAVAAASAPRRLHRAALSIPQTGTGTAPLAGVVLLGLGVLLISTSRRRRQPVHGLPLDDELPWYW